MSDNQNHDGREATRIYLTGTCEGFPELAEALSRHPELELVGQSDRVVDGAAPLTGGHLDVVVHATRAASLPTDELASIREYTIAPIVLVASGEASALLDEALAADVADVLLLPQLSENAAFAIRKASKAGRRRQPGSTAGRVITVFSPKGGTGKTVTATNLAASFAKFGRKRTLLLDLDLQFGDAAIMLSIEPDKTIQDLVSAPGELDPEKLSGYTTRHSSGIEVLPAPVRPEDAELVTEAKLTRLLEVARQSYDVIVVDTSPFFHGPMLATLDRTDMLVLVCGLDVPSIKNVRLSLQTLELLSFPPNRVRVLLNRANSQVGLKRAEVEAALEIKIAYEVPSDRAVPLSVNRGAPAVISEGQSDYARALRQVAEALLPATPESAKRRWLPTLAKA